jgi:fucose permease
MKNMRMPYFGFGVVVLVIIIAALLGGNPGLAKYHKTSKESESLSAMTAHATNRNVVGRHLQGNRQTGSGRLAVC